MKKVLNFLFPSKERETILNEKSNDILNDLLTLGFSYVEISIIIENVRSQTSDNIESQRKNFILQLKNLNMAQTILTVKK